MIDPESAETSAAWRPTAIDALVVLVPWVAVVVLAMVVEAAVSSSDRQLGEYPRCVLGAALIVALVAAILCSLGYGVARYIAGARRKIERQQEETRRQLADNWAEAERLARQIERLSLHPAAPRSVGDIKTLLGDKSSDPTALLALLAVSAMHRTPLRDVEQLQSKLDEIQRSIQTPVNQARDGKSSSGQKKG